MKDVRPITIDIIINAQVSETWKVLTEPELMAQWMSEESLEIATDWKVGNPICIKGEIHDVRFENRGKVLQFLPYRLLSYEHLSSLSKLPDEPASYTAIEFKLQAAGDQTFLTIILSNFPTDSIYHHLKFYWRTTVFILKDFVERSAGM